MSCSNCQITLVILPIVGMSYVCEVCGASKNASPATVLVSKEALDQIESGMLPIGTKVVPTCVGPKMAAPKGTGMFYLQERSDDCATVFLRFKESEYISRTLGEFDSVSEAAEALANLMYIN